MSLFDALVITALGMGAVFVGLILTALLITSFSLVTRFEQWRANQARLIATVVPSVKTTRVDDATLAVIWTVLEVERRLNGAASVPRLTILRTGDSRSHS